MNRHRGATQVMERRRTTLDIRRVSYDNKLDRATSLRDVRV